MRALAAGVLIMVPALHQQAAAQEFSADAAVATDNSGEPGFVPNALNLAAAEVSGAGAVLERQELIPVTTLPRTCDCVPADDVVRLLCCVVQCQEWPVAPPGQRIRTCMPTPNACVHGRRCSPTSNPNTRPSTA